MRPPIRARRSLNLRRIRELSGRDTIVVYVAENDELEAVAYAGDESAEELIGTRSPLSDWRELLDSTTTKGT